MGSPKCKDKEAGKKDGGKGLPIASFAGTAFDAMIGLAAMSIGGILINICMAHPIGYNKEVQTVVLIADVFVLGLMGFLEIYILKKLPWPLYELNKLLEKKK